MYFCVKQGGNKKFRGSRNGLYEKLWVVEIGLYIQRRKRRRMSLKPRMVVSCTASFNQLLFNIVEATLVFKS